jgi:hypothetical protein
MNDRIRQLAEQAGIGYGNLSTGHGDNWQFAGRPEELERFAQLIVKECAEIANDHNSEVEGVTLGVGRALKQHFGVAE